jgi:DEAD/DEAH box helicase domain-containing protein
MKTRDEQLEDWMRAVFQKTGSAAEHYPVFAELFFTVFNCLLNEEKIDAMECPDQPLDAESPELGTARAYIEQKTPELFHHYLDCLNRGHSLEFARIFALKVDEHCGDVESASREAFEAIRTDWDCTMSNRAFAEAHAVCLRQGRSTLFSEKCAEYLIGGDFCFSRAQAKASTYEKTFEECRAKGYPLIRAKAFAEYLARPDVSEVRSFAEAFARVYEEQDGAGKSHTEAWDYADTFVDYYQLFCGWDWEESESDGGNDRARIHATGDLRGRGKGFNRTDYAKMFASFYNTASKRPDQPLAARLAEVEARTDVEMKERALRRVHRDDKVCIHGTVYLDLETKSTAVEAGGWDKLDQLGVSIAVTITSDGPRVFTEDNIQKLVGVLARAERIVGYNIRDFDFKVLEGYVGFSIGQARIVDLLDEVERAAECRVSLQALASGTLGIHLSRDSLDMVKCWKDGEVLDVIEGCYHDVLAIKALDEYARENGVLFYFSPETQQRERIAVLR